MKRTALFLILVVVLVAGPVFAGAGLLNLPDGCELVGTRANGETVWICPPAPPTATPTATATDTPTATATEPPTATPTTPAPVCGSVTRYAGTGTTIAPRNMPWNYPEKITADDNQYAFGGGFSSSDVTDFLRASGFGFDVPAGATVAGIVVEIGRFQNVTPGNTLRDSVVRLTVGGTNRADTVTVWPNVEAVKAYGGPADTWGTALTPAVVNAADFGVELRAAGTVVEPEGVTAGAVDFIRATVHYCQ